MSAFKPQIEYQDLKLLFSFHCKVMKKIQNDSNQKKYKNKPRKLHIRLFLSGQYMEKFLVRNKLMET